VKNAGPLAAIFIIQLVSFTIVCARWKVLTKALNIPVSLKTCIKTGYQGLSLSLLVPGSLGFDGIRILYINNHHKKCKLAGIASVLMDRILGLVGLLMLTVGACGFYWLLFDEAGLGLLLILSGILLMLVIFIIYMLCVVAPKLSYSWIKKYTVVENTLQAFQIYNNHKLAMLVSTFISISGHFIHCIAWLVAINMIGISPDILGVVAVTSVITIIRTIPITPLGLGVTDIAAESIYSLIDITAGAEIQMLIRVVTIILLLFFGLSFYNNHRILDSQKTRLT